MREIKFRTFHRGRMEILREFNEHHIFFDDDGMQTIQGDMHLMQYTGLKDKNGVEIYEGDICRYKNDGSYWVGMVRYNHCSYMFSSDRGQNLIYTLDREVIGNIHENPELLK